MRSDPRPADPRPEVVRPSGESIGGKKEGDGWSRQPLGSRHTTSISCADRAPRSSRPTTPATTTRVASGTRSTIGGPRSSSGRRAPRRSRPRSASRASTTSRSPSDPAATARPGSRAPNGGLLVDLSGMRGVEVDPRTRTARVERRRAPRRARRRRPGARPRLPDRRRRPHRRRRADARWRSRPPAAPLRAHDRQPDGRRARHRRRPARPRDRDRGARALLGPARRRLELRDRDRVRVPAPAVRSRAPPRRPDLPGDPGPGRSGAVFRDYALQRARHRVVHLRHRPGGARTPATRTTMVGKPIVFFAWNHSGAADDVERDTAALRVGPKPLTDDHRQRSRTSTSRPPTTSRSPGAAARSSRATTRTTSVPRRSTSWSSSSRPRPGRATFSVTALGGAIGRVAEDATAYAGRAVASST